MFMKDHEDHEASWRLQACALLQEQVNAYAYINARDGEDRKDILETIMGPNTL